MNVPTVETLMTHKVVTLKPEQDIYEAMKLLLEHKISGAPVVDEHCKLLGILSEKDCLKVISKSAFTNERRPPGLVADYMSKEVVTCNVHDDLFIICDRFFEHSFRRLPVVEEGVLIGLISRRDVLLGSLNILKNEPADAKKSDSTYLSDDLKAKLSEAHSVDQSAIRVDATVK